MLFSFTACGTEEPVADSSKLLQESLYNMYALQSFKYKADFTADMKDAETKEEVSMDMGFNGAVSGQDQTKPGTEFTVVAKADDTTGEFRFDFSAKFFQEDIYLKLLALPSVPNFPVDGLKGLVGKWWRISASDLGDLNATKGLEGFGVAYDKLDETSKKKRDLILSAKFFSDIKYEGTDTLDALTVYKYNFVVDGDGVYKYLYELAKIDGQENTTDLKDVKTMLNDNVFTGSMMIDSVSKTMVSANLSLDKKKSKDGQFTAMNFALGLSDINKPFNVEIPTDFEVFDLGKFLGSFLGGGVDTGEAVVPEVPAEAPVAE